MSNCHPRRDGPNRSGGATPESVNDNAPIDWNVDYEGGILHQPWDPQDLTWLGDPWLPQADGMRDLAQWMIARTRDW